MNETTKGAILVTVEKGENKRGKTKDADGNEVPMTVTYYTARLGMTGTKAYVNVSEGRRDILKAAGMPPAILARLDKAIAAANAHTAKDPAAKVTATKSTKESVATF